MSWWKNNFMLQTYLITQKEDIHLNSEVSNISLLPGWKWLQLVCGMCAQTIAFHPQTQYASTCV